MRSQIATFVQQTTDMCNRNSYEGSRNNGRGTLCDEHRSHRGIIID